MVTGNRHLYEKLVCLGLACGVCCCSSVTENTGMISEGNGDGGDSAGSVEPIDTAGAGAQDHAEDTSSGEGCPAMKVIIPPYDFEESDIAVVDLEYLDALATEYVCALEGAPLDSDQFLYGWAPTKLFNEIISGNTDNISIMRWILHLSGYFGGVWLHNGLSANNPQDRGVDTDEDTDSAGMDFALLDGEKIARQAISALEGPENKLFEYNKNSLLAFLLPNLGMAWNFGYNRGYLLEIYLRPPKGITPPPDYVSCKGLLWCEYQVARLPILASLGEVSADLGSKGGRWQELREGGRLNPLDGIKAAQNAGNSMGQMVWGSFFNKSDMADPEFYLGLLDVSASFLEVVQAAGLLSARGYAERDLEAARQGALIQSGLGYWLAAYMKSFSGGSRSGGDLQPLPTIVPVDLAP